MGCAGRQGESWQDSGTPQMLLLAAALLAAWLLLLAVKLGLGYALKLVAGAYMRHYEERQARARWAARGSKVRV